MTTDTGTTKTELGNYIHKVERKPAETLANWYEVMLSPFKTRKEAISYIAKYKCYYPSEDQTYRITKIKCNQDGAFCDDAPDLILHQGRMCQTA
jgi:hypothetical protein